MANKVQSTKEGKRVLKGGQDYFRVWNRATKTMHYPDWKELAMRATLTEMKLLPGIGRRDKHGRNIYDGDIVMIDGTELYKHGLRQKRDYYKGVYVIRQINGSFGNEYYWERISGYRVCTRIMGDEDDSGRYPNVEVLGNTYEKHTTDSRSCFPWL